MKTILLHLSDSHFSSPSASVLGRSEHIAATLRTVFSDACAVFILFTGDLTNSGELSEFKLAGAFLENLKSQLKSEFGGQIEIIVTPGNHDGTFKQSSATRKTMIQALRSNALPEVDDELIDTCTKPLANFFQFEKEVCTSNPVYSDKLWKEYRYSLAGKIVRISAINPSWVSTVPEGETVFPVSRYSDLHDDLANIHILLMHHPLNWYAQGSYHPLREMVKDNYQLVLSGHEHTRGFNSLTDIEKRSTIFCEAPALDSDNQSAFSIIVLDLATDSVAQESFVWNGTYYQPQNLNATWGNFWQIPIKNSKHGFHLTEHAKELLEALDASFSHPEQERILLSDVFISPDLNELNIGTNKQIRVNSSEFLQLKDEHEKVLIYGDEQFGKTSLLKHLYSDFLNLGLKPLIFDANQASVPESGFRLLVDRLASIQYGEKTSPRYAQVPLSEKIALVDNLDGLGSRGDVLARVLKNIEGQFGRVIIVAGERYEVTVMASTDATAATKEYKTFRMLGFGYKLRHDLIRKWYAIGNHINESDYQQKVHTAESVINGVLGKGLVPMTAFNTLVLLQTFEINERGSLANAGTAQYYEFMFRHSLFQARVRVDEVDEIISYLVYLSWRFYGSKLKAISTNELMQFNHWFSQEMHPTDPIERLDLLVSARILIKKDEGYAFAYSYLEYFFVAKYLAINSENEDIKHLIKRLCQHLYLRQNANIVLFLIHHLDTSTWVIEEIGNLLSAILSNIPILKLEQDAGILNTWVNEKVKLVVDTTNIVENNRKSREHDDSAARIPEYMPDQEVSSIHELDQITQLNLLFKTGEILGQVLKSRYGSLSNQFKNDLIKRLFDAPLRGINFFLSIINSEPDALLMDMTSHLQNKKASISAERADRQAKQYLFYILGSVADSFISRQGEIIGTPKLNQIIDQVVQSDQSLAYRIVSVASKLSYPGIPPIDEIRSLAEAMDRNFFGYKLLQGLVARHLYMFSIQHTDKVRLAAAVGIADRAQRGIEFRSQASKKLPKSQNKRIHVEGLLNRLQRSFILQNQGVLDYLETHYGKKSDKNKN